MPRAPSSTLFPYTTLFRSHLLLGLHAPAVAATDLVTAALCAILPFSWGHRRRRGPLCKIGFRPRLRHRHRHPSSTRSEEHTSELQSPYDLVCRLLLEKKKK